VPRKSKTPSGQAAASADATPPEPTVVPPAEVRKLAKKRSSRKTAAKKSTRPSRQRNAAEPARHRRHPTDEEIRMRAYFIAERRVQMGIPASEHDDWLEARRQLEAELGG